MYLLNPYLLRLDSGRAGPGEGDGWSWTPPTPVTHAVGDEMASPEHRALRTNSLVPGADLSDKNS